MEWKGNLALDDNKINSHNLNSLIFQTPPYQPTNGFKAEKKKDWRSMALATQK